MSILNIAAYKFIELEAQCLPNLQTMYRARAKHLGLKGTILLSTEGINLFLAGEKLAIVDFKSFVAETPQFSNLQYKQSPSSNWPFKRLFVKIKKEIISFGVDSVKPFKNSAPCISPQQLREWYASNQDMIVLDTRNQYEVERGGFEQAVHLNIDSFREFPQAIRTLPEEYKQKPIVTFCTGGIRCEKAALYLMEHGFKNVYQLEGGILNYFEQCGNAYYQGDCFVFDERTALDHQLGLEGD